MIGIQGLLSDEEFAYTEEFTVKYARWCIQYTDMVKFIEGLGIHARQTLQLLNDEEHRKVLESIETLTMRIVEGVINIQAERNHRNNADDDLPCVLPHKLVKLLTAKFEKIIVDVHLQQLHHS